MRCKKHLSDLTSTIGVCASCLRERLQPIFVAQAKSGENASHTCERKPKPKPKPELEEKSAHVPLNFPRSVSPYVARRKSDCDQGREKLFFGTPQVGVTAGNGVGAASEKKRHGGKFWILSNIFRPRSNKTCEERTSSASAQSTASWLSTMLPARHQNHGECDRRRRRQADRGLSPPTAVDFGEEVEAVHDRSDSGNSTESSPQKQSQKQNPTAANRRSRLGTGAGGKGVTAFCLSPLVRASPNRHWTHNNNNTKGLAQEMGGGGAHHRSNAASFCGNRSRKLADFGRVAHNR